MNTIYHGISMCLMLYLTLGLSTRLLADESISVDSSTSENQNNAVTQKETDPLYDMNVEDLLDIPITVVTKKKVRSKELPAAITVITREELLKSGARDLVDALTLFVPGITFGSEVEGVVGINFRGMWGMEGKVLLMVDSLEMNERVFGSTL